MLDEPGIFVMGTDTGVGKTAVTALKMAMASVRDLSIIDTPPSGSRNLTGP